MGAMKDGVIKRGNTWSFVVRELDPVTGKSKQRWQGGFKNEDDAKAARDLARVAARRGESVTIDRITVGDYLTGWVETIEVKPKTRAGYRYNINRYVVPRIGSLPLQVLRPTNLNSLYAGLRRDGGRNGGELGYTTVKSVHRTLSTALTAAVRTQLLHSNPAERATLPPKPVRALRDEHDEQDVRVFTPGQLQEFLRRANQHRLGPLFHLAAFSGARRGELLYLRWRHLDLDAGVMRICGTRSLADGKPIEGTPKGGRSRAVSLDARTVEVLRGLRDRQDAEREAAGALWLGADEGFAFTTAVGAPIYPDTPSSLMKKFCSEAGVHRRRFHDLRHTHATILLSSGTPVHEVADRLGHADATITLRVYASVLRDRADGLGEAFAAALAGG